MIFGLLTTAISLLAGYLIAVWQNRRSDRQSDSWESTLKKLPQEFIEALKQGSLTVAAIPERLSNLEDDWPSIVSFADVNNDGKQELLVQYIAGAHGNRLQILGWRDHEYVQIAHIAVGVPVPFEFGDFDNDGNIEILGKESDWSTGLPYSLVPRYSFRLRWDGTNFQEVWRANDYSEDDLARLKAPVASR